MTSIAVVGGSAAAYGVLLALLHSSRDLEITLINPSRSRAAKSESGARLDWTDVSLKSFYSGLRRQAGFAFPPPKSSFGVAPQRRLVSNWGRLWASDFLGGLTEFWGLSSMAYDRADFVGWPLELEDFAPHYKAVTNAMGIAPTKPMQTDTQSLEYQRPAAVTGEAVWRTIGAGYRGRTGQYEIAFTGAHLALETRPGHARECIACGHCMIGCPRNSMFSAGDAIEDWLNAGEIHHFIEGRVIRIDHENRTLVIETASGEMSEAFDTIFICAGTLGSAEIGLRSFSQLPHIDITDSSAVTFPIFTSAPEGGDRHLALTSGLILCRPLEDGLPAGQVQLYSAFDHLWRFYAPTWSWALMKPFGRWLRRHVIIARLFFDESVSQKYRLSLASDGTARLALLRAPVPESERPILNALRDVLGFKSVIPLLKKRQKTSSHYLGGLPLGGNFLSPNGEAAGGVYFADGVTFPTAPATSPTLTIMANAHRVATQWMSSR